MATKTQLTFVERLEKHGATKSVACKIDSILSDRGFMDMTLADLLKIPGMGRKNALLVVEVACDLAGKK